MRSHQSRSYYSSSPGSYARYSQPDIEYDPTQYVQPHQQTNLQQLPFAYQQHVPQQYATSSAYNYRPQEPPWPEYSDPSYMDTAPLINSCIECEMANSMSENYRYEKKRYNKKKVYDIMTKKIFH